VFVAWVCEKPHKTGDGKVLPLAPCVPAHNTMVAFLRTLVVLVLLHAANSAEYAPFVTFNNGLVTADRNCTDLEMTLISDTVKKAAVQGARRRRRLGWDKQHHRGLGLVKCTPLMAWATSKCGGAKATRRRLQAQEAPTAAMTGRKLQSNICDANITKFNDELDSVASKVSSKCSAFITTRSYECRQVLDCDIVAFHTWNAGNNTIFKSNFAACKQYPLLL
jgi:hypothetical protein